MVSSFQFEVRVLITLLEHCGIRFARDVPFHETKYQVISSVDQYGRAKVLVVNYKRATTFKTWALLETDRYHGSVLPWLPF